MDIIRSSRFPDKKHYSSLRADRTGKSSGNVKEPQKQGIIYYSEKVNLLQQDRLSPGYHTQYPFSYNLSNTREINVQQTPRSRVSNFDERVLIGRNRTSGLYRIPFYPGFRFRQVSLYMMSFEMYFV
jgi:hypothetical protein